MEEAFFENNRVDALAMERLTASPFVMNLYSYCGMTVVTEYAPKEVADVANKMNSTARLELAAQVAQGLADIHSIDNSSRTTLVHNDLNLANLVLTPDNVPVLNDFNIAILLMKHNETDETCPFYSHFPNPQWTSPEQQVENDRESDENPPVVTEKVDIYAFGNVLYKLAVGKSPWKKPDSKKLSSEEKQEVARLKKYNGTMPAVPSNLTETADSATLTLLDAMYHCYRFEPSERPTAQQVASFLKDALESEKLAGSST